MFKTFLINYQNTIEKIEIGGTINLKVIRTSWELILKTFILVRLEE
jgi:hypothetical protein